MADPQPVTTDQEILAQVRDELRALNTRLGDAEPSRPAVADGLRVDQPEPEAEADDSYCPECDRTFASPSGLASHRRAKHEA